MFEDILRTPAGFCDDACLKAACCNFCVNFGELSFQRSLGNVLQGVCSITKQKKRGDSEYCAEFYCSIKAQKEEGGCLRI